MPDRTIPIERIVYRPAEALEDREVDFVYLGEEDLKDDFWACRRGEALLALDSGSDSSVADVASDIWRRVHSSILSRHFFKKINWRSFFNHVVEKKKGLGRTLGKTALDRVVEAGRRRCRGGLPSLDELLVRLHFAEDILPSTGAGKAGQFLEKNAAEIILEERNLLIEKRAHKVRLEGRQAAEINYLLRSRFNPLRAKAKSEGLDLEAVHLESLIRTIESMNTFYENIYTQLQEEMTTTSCRIFRFLHIAGARQGGAIPVPVVWSKPLGSLLLFLAGDQEGKWSLDEFVLVPDLLAVLEGGNPLAPPLDKAIFATIGLVEYFRTWALFTRDRQRETRPKKSDLSLRDTDPESW
jgi:hypothetical protein